MKDFLPINLEGFSKYYASKDGKIALRNKNGILKILSDRPNAYGYRRVSLVNDDGKRVDRYVHVILARTFIDNPENKPYVNHIDGNKANNTLSNLEWVTRSENATHSHNILHNVASHKPCYLYRFGEFVGEFEDIKKASEYANEHYGASKTLLQKTYTSNGCAIIKKGVTTIQ